MRGNFVNFFNTAQKLSMSARRWNLWISSHLCYAVNIGLKILQSATFSYYHNSTVLMNIFIEVEGHLFAHPIIYLVICFVTFFSVAKRFPNTFSVINLFSEKKTGYFRELKSKIAKCMRCTFQTIVVEKQLGFLTDAALNCLAIQQLHPGDCILAPVCRCRLMPNRRAAARFWSCSVISCHWRWWVVVVCLPSPMACMRQAASN